MLPRIIYLFRISWRDLWRNRRRTVLVGMSMVFSAFIMVFSVGMNAGLVDEMGKTVTGSFLGHAQIQTEGFAENPNLEQALSGAQVEAYRVQFGNLPEVLAWAPRLVTGGLMNKKIPEPLDENDLSAYRKMTSEGVMLLGIDPKLESTVSTLAESVLPDEPRRRCLRGCEAALAENYQQPDQSCLDLCPDDMQEFAGESCRTACSRLCAGRCPADDEWCEDELCEKRCFDYCEPARFLANEDIFAEELYRGEVVLGTDLAHVLKAGVGDRVAMTIGTADGRTHGAIYRVSGLIRTTQVQLNRTIALTHRHSLSQGVNLSGGATSLVLKFDNFEAAPAFAAGIEEKVQDVAEISALRVRSWGELAPDVETFMKLKLGGTYVFTLVFTLVVAVIVANVVTMAVLERTREYGVRLALGESPSRLMASVYIESLLLAVVASIVGCISGGALVTWYGKVGLDMGVGQMETAGVILTGILYPKATTTGYLFALVSVLVFSLVGTIYPALRIRRIRVMDALYFS